MKVAIVIEKAGQNYCAWSPDIPGCTVTGDSPEALRAVFPERLKEFLTVVRQEGGALPEPTSQVEIVDLGDVA